MNGGRGGERSCCSGRHDAESNDMNGGADARACDLPRFTLHAQICSDDERRDEREKRRERELSAVSCSSRKDTSSLKLRA